MASGGPSRLRRVPGCGAPDGFSRVSIELSIQNRQKAKLKKQDVTRSNAYTVPISRRPMD
jgi:hypothetical protein